MTRLREGVRNQVGGNAYKEGTEVVWYSYGCVVNRLNLLVKQFSGRKDESKERQDNSLIYNVLCVYVGREV